MLTLAHPWALLLLALIPPLAWRYWHKPRAAWRFADARLLPAGKQPRVRRARRGGLLLRAGGLLAVVLALAGPRVADPASRIPTEGIAVALVLDTSASMAEADFAWGDEKIPRLDGVRRVVHRFIAGDPDGDLPGRPDDLISLVTFAARPDTACPLTLDHRALLQILDAVEPRRASGDATTNPGDAVAWALAGLQTAPVPRKAVVLLTDGESNVPEGLTPRQAAQLAANLHVPVYAVDAAPDAPAPTAAEGAAKARESLKAVAAMTGGAYFRAPDRPALVAACAEIDRLQRGPIETPVYRRHDELFAGFALAGLACWAAALVLESTVWRSVP